MALRAYTSRQMAGLKVYLLLGNEIKMTTLRVEGSIFQILCRTLNRNLTYSKVTYAYSLKPTNVGKIN